MPDACCAGHFKSQKVALRFNVSELRSWDSTWMHRKTGSRSVGPCDCGTSHFRMPYSHLQPWLPWLARQIFFSFVTQLYPRWWVDFYDIHSSHLIGISLAMWAMLICSEFTSPPWKGQSKTFWLDLLVLPWSDLEHFGDPWWIPIDSATLALASLMFFSSKYVKSCLCWSNFA